MNQSIRSGCKDIWNAFMVNGASFGKYDIPFCPTTAPHIPDRQVTWEEAHSIHFDENGKMHREDEPEGVLTK